jgi:palmitoyl-protein thioesterase
MYSDFFQKHLSIASYWRDPRQLNSYLVKCLYLPILNNEINNSFAESQTDHIKNLSNFVMIWSPFDTVLNPPESGKFSFLDDSLNIVRLEDTDLYKNDLLGLKFLNENNRLHMYETNCTHVDHRNPICYSQLYDILNQYL